MTIADQLCRLLACTYSLASQAHMAHWNVTGRAFPSLHKLFGNQYEDLYEAADAIAEYIRSKNPKTFAPGGLTELSKLSTIKELPCTGLPEDKYLEGLTSGHAIIIAYTKELVDDALKMNDQDTANFAIERSTAHKKMRWMLIATLG